MLYVVLGIVVLAGLVLLGRLFVSLDSQTLVRLLRYVAGIALLAIGATFALGGRLGLGLPALVLGAGVLFTGRIGSLDFGTGTRSRGRHSTVRSRFVTATLDHDSGTLTGSVVDGTFAGRKLDELTDEELKALHAEVTVDRDSEVLVEAYLDRRIPGWREDGEADGAARPRSPADAGAMTDEEAYQILGLPPGAGEPEIRAAHHRLMKGVHPDRGGSGFLAARINEARDRLLGKHD